MRSKYNILTMFVGIAIILSIGLISAVSAGLVPDQMGTSGISAPSQSGPFSSSDPKIAPLLIAPADQGLLAIPSPSGFQEPFLTETETGTIFFSSSPSKAEIYLDGGYIGYTPLLYQGVTVGNHAITLKKAGYHDYSKTVSVSKSFATSVIATLEASTGSLYVSSVPSGADIYINSSPVGRTNLLFEGMDPGTKDVRLNLSGYSDFKGTITVYAGSTTYLGPVILKPTSSDYGSISVSTVPAYAEVYLDGSLVGKTPLLKSQVKKGTYSLTLSMNGYQSFTQMVTIRSGRDTNLGTRYLTQTTGSLSVTSVPSSAEVLIDGQYVGMTPLFLPNILAGKHNFKISITGYASYNGSVIVTGGKRTEVGPITLSPLPPGVGSLFISSFPTGADTYLDGEYKGKTTVLVENLKAGNYIFMLQKQGYNPYTGTVTVEAGRINLLNMIHLTPMYGSLAVSSYPEGASVYLNDKFIGYTHLQMSEVEPGNYKVQIEYPGYESYSKQVTVQSGSQSFVYAFLNLKFSSNQALNVSLAKT